MQRYLEKRALWDDGWKQQITDSINAEIEEAVEFAEKSPYPEPEEALDHVYSFSIRERELNRRPWSSCPGATSKQQRLG